MSRSSEDTGLASYLRDQELLISVACRIVHERAVAEELVQESWLRWVQKEYDVKQARPIFRRIVSNLALDWLRRRRNETVLLQLNAPSELDFRDAERVVLARDELRRMVRALNKLPPRTVTAFRLSRVEGLTYREIADRLDTVPSRVHGYVVKALATIAVELMD